MDYGVIFVIVLLSTLTLALEENVTESLAYDYDDDYYDYLETTIDPTDSQETEDLTPVSKNNLKKAHTKDLDIIKVKRDREELTTEKQIAKYEVTELVLDVPDTNTRRVPIVTNFTITRPLNLAGIPNNKTDNSEGNVKDEGDEIINSILIPKNPTFVNNHQDKSIKERKFNYDSNEDDDFSNFNPKESFEEEFNKHFGRDEDEFEGFEVNEEPKLSKSFKDHFHNFKKGIVNEFKSVIDKHKGGIHDSLHKIVHGPISFFSKLHRKSSDLVKKLHDTVSRRKYHNMDDDIDDTGYHEYND